MFRSYRPGFFPWFLEGEEARSLAEALEQLLDVAPRFGEDRALLAPDDQNYLVCVSSQAGGTTVWEDEVIEVPPPEPALIRIEISPEELEDLERLPRSGHELEMDLFMLPLPIQEEKEARPMFPYMLLTVETGSGAVLGTELLEPTPSLRDMWGSVPRMVHGNSPGWKSSRARSRWGRSCSSGFYDRWPNHRASSSSSHAPCRP